MPAADDCQQVLVITVFSGSLGRFRRKLVAARQDQLSHIHVYHGVPTDCESIYEEMGSDQFMFTSGTDRVRSGKSRESYVVRENSKKLGRTSALRRKSQFQENSAFSRKQSEKKVGPGRSRILLAFMKKSGKTEAVLKES